MQSKGETIPLDSEEGGEGSQHSEEEDTRSGEKGAHQESHDQSQKESREDVNGERQGNKIESEEEQDDITPQIGHQPAPLKAEEQDTQPRSTVTQGIHQDNGREQVKGQEGAQDNTHKVKGQSGTKKNQGEQGVTEQGRNEQDTEQMDDGDSREYLESRGPAMLQQRVQETGVKEKEEREGEKEAVKKDEQEEEEEESGNSGSSGEEEGKCMAENPEDCKDPNPFPSEEQEPNYGMC